MTFWSSEPRVGRLLHSSHRVIQGIEWLVLVRGASISSATMDRSSSPTHFNCGCGIVVSPWKTPFIESFSGTFYGDCPIRWICGDGHEA